MLKFINRRSAQSLVEYITIITLLLGAFLAISNYFKRGVQGRLKDATDQMGDQYDPRTAKTDITHRVNSLTTTIIFTENTADGYWTNRQDIVDSVETKTGFTDVGAY